MQIVEYIVYLAAKNEKSHLIFEVVKHLAEKEIRESKPDVKLVSK